MAETDNTNQKNYQSTQDYQIDIIKVYESFIKPIDEMRSKTNVTSPQNKGLIKNKMKDTTARTNSIRSLLKPEIDYQESRCHAFYRLIGFPVYNGTNFYNPGYDKHFSSSKKIKQADKEEIRSSMKDNFVKLSDKRETFAQDFLALFSNNTTIDACVVALSSSANTRKFAIATENIEDSLEDMDPETQSYKLSLEGRVGKFRPKLTEYVAANGAVPTSKLQDKRYHIITPFLTDARYDITVPTKQMVAVPFVTDASKLRSTEVDSVKRPWIEKVIEDRSAVIDPKTSGTASKTITEFISNNQNIVDEDLIKYSLSYLSGTTVTEQTYFIKFIEIIKEMIRELVDAQKNSIEKVQKQYYWLPIPSKIGPEGGSSVRSLLVNKDISNKKVLTTKLDYDMTIALFNKMVAQAAKKYDTAESKGNFVFSGGEFVNIFDAQNPDEENNVSTKSYDEMDKVRTKWIKQANEALKIVEIIMGEFSGLGLCDIIAVIGSLYIMPLENLYGFLDDDAFDRMKSALNKPSAERSTLELSISSLTTNVKQFYSLMDKLYENELSNSTRS